MNNRHYNIKQDQQLTGEVIALLQTAEGEQYLRLIVRLLSILDNRLKAIETHQEQSLLHFRNKVFTIHEVAQLLKVSTTTIRRLVEEQQIKKFQCFGKLQFTGQSILELIQNNPKYYGSLDDVRVQI